MILSHDIAGSGPAVLLLHSTVCDRRMWDPQLPALTAAGHRVVRCDLRGYGETPAPDCRHNDAEDVVALLDRLGIDQAALVGSSGGGRVALEVAARWPHRVTALALLCTARRGHEAGASLRAFGAREDELLEAGDVDGATRLNVETWLGPDADDTVRDKVHTMQRRAFDVQLAVEEEHEPLTAEYDLAAIAAPTLLVSGDHDFDDFRAIADHLAAHIPDARRLHLPWAGHLPGLERPEAVNALLTGFLAGTA
ncbi:alpha/beta fold hydrolase [Kitasatospora sp. NPDC054939]